MHVFQFIWPWPVSSPDRKKNLLSCFSTLLSFLLFVLFLFYFGGRLAGLSMAHICSSSLLVFTTALGLPPPRLIDRERKKDGDDGIGECSW